LMEARPQTSFAAKSSKGKTEWESPFDTPPVEHLSLAGAPSGKDLQLPAAGQSQGDLKAPPVASVQTEVSSPLILTSPQRIPSSSRLPFNPDEGLDVTGVRSTDTGNAWTQQAASSGQAAEIGEPRVHDMVPLGQIDSSFIVAADRGALLIIDQHVAHERVLFEKVLRQRSEGRVESQRLLLPILVELTPRQQVILESITPELVACGFEVEPFGRKTIAVKAAPADLTSTEIEHLLNELLESLEKETQAVNLPRLREKIAASIACHAAIKVNTPLEQSKMVWLIDQLMKTQFPMTCPHGRPIILRYEKNEILKAFKRI
jgi:DNA mismatch repair protein MutL